MNIEEKIDVQKRRVRVLKTNTTERGQQLLNEALDREKAKLRELERQADAILVNIERIEHQRDHAQDLLDTATDKLHELLELKRSGLAEELLGLLKKVEKLRGEIEES